MSTPWTVLVGQYWHTAWLRNETDAEVAANEVRSFFGERNQPSNDELCNVIRWMAGPANRQEKPPTLRELIRAVCIRRKEARVADDRPGRHCSLCNGSGWTDEWPGLHPPYQSAEDFSYGYSHAVPCGCNTGRAVAEKFFPGGWMAAEPLARRAQEQRVARDRLITEWFASADGKAYRDTIPRLVQVVADELSAVPAQGEMLPQQEIPARG